MMQLGQHISQKYNQELEDIRSKVLKMGGLVEAQAGNAVKALLERDNELAHSVASSDHLIDQMEVELDDECIQVIARRQPAARDLRLVIAVGKVITDLERIGDEAEQIALYAAKLAEKKTISGMHAELSHMAQLVLKILHNSLDSFARMEVRQALDILEMTKQVNQEFNILTRLLITHMMEDPRNVKNVLRITWCARSLERIGDHSSNIAEYVIFLVKGKDIRHTSLRKIRSEFFPD
jgi:phosphate transport system protein